MVALSFDRIMQERTLVAQNGGRDSANPLSSLPHYCW
jgi:hypothetical protein